MKFFTSRCAVALAAAAIASMAASPALARDWNWGGYGGHRHQRHGNGVDAGDIFAGLLVIGGIAAIASAATKSERDKRDRDDRYPDGDRREEGARYGEPRAGDYRPRDRYAEADRSADMAVETCVDEIERGNREVGSVDSVNRESEGWRIDGLLSGGREFSCTVDRDGRILRAAVDGRAL